MDETKPLDPDELWVKPWRAVLQAESVEGDIVNLDHGLALIAGEDIQAPCFVYIGKDGKAYMARANQEPK